MLITLEKFKTRSIDCNLNQAQRSAQIGCRLRNKISLIRNVSTVKASGLNSLAFLICAIISLSACQSKPTKFSAGPVITEGQWEAAAAIKDKAKNKTHYINLEIAAVHPNHLKINATATLGIYIGSFVLNETETKLISIPEKKFFVGPRSPEVFSRLTKLALDPADFLKILFEMPLSPNRWKCKESEIHQTCELNNSDVKFRQSKNEDNERIIEFISAKTNLKLSLKLLKNQVAQKETAFKLEAPASFKIYRLN